MNNVEYHHLIKPKQVSPLPVGSGGTNSTKKRLIDTNTQLAMLQSQATADTKYDPPVPQHITKPTTKESFIELSNIYDKYDISLNYKLIGVIGIISILYGLIGK
jgi:hypothetical protein